MSDYFTWSNDEERAEGYLKSQASLEYGTVPKAKAWTNTYIDIESGRSVRPQFGRKDYNAFRRNEAVPKKQKDIIKVCMDAYDKVGIIHNVIDLMGDFASQGISLVHEDQKIESFFRKWFSKVKGTERSERFLNYLYRTGNVILFRDTGLISNKRAKDFKKSKADSLSDQDPKTNKRRIPIKYTFLNPLAVEVSDEIAAKTLGDRQYVLNVAASTAILKSSKYKQRYADLPESLRKSIDKNGYIPLDSDKTKVYHYKKDDWKIWSNPMIYPIMDNVVTLEKMRLADLAALDGAISNVRLWNVGSLEHKIGPNKAVINRLRDILASHTGGGTIDLVWGPELTFTESNTQIYRFLGQEKYIPVLTAIYGGLGIPSTLTGSGNSSNQGYTNNFVSIKTLIERLEYGRELLKDFWIGEMEMVAKAMGFKSIPTIHFDAIILSDEAAQKKLMIELADRNIISDKTLLERFKEIPHVEKSRISKEEKERRNQKNNVPEKAGPYHTPNLDDEIVKILMNKGLMKKEYLEERSIPVLDNFEELNKESLKPKETGLQNPKKQPGSAGRPKSVKDSTKRQQKRVLPRSSASVMMWANKAQAKISEVITPMVLKQYGKKNMRGLTKKEFADLEDVKLKTLASFSCLTDVTEESIAKVFVDNVQPNPYFLHTYAVLLHDFVVENDREPSVDEARQMQILALLETEEI